MTGIDKDFNDKMYIIELTVCIENEGDRFPDEETLVMVIKKFIRKSVNSMKNNHKIVSMKSNIYEAGYDEPYEDEEE